MLFRYVCDSIILNLQLFFNPLDTTVLHDFVKPNCKVNNQWISFKLAMFGSSKFQSLAELQLPKENGDNRFGIRLCGKTCRYVLRLLYPKLVSDPTGHQLVRQILHLIRALHLQRHLHPPVKHNKDRSFTTSGWEF